jgi:hypothetical protein
MLKWIINYFCKREEKDEEIKIIKEFLYSSSIHENYFNNMLVDNVFDITYIIKNLNDIDLKSLNKNDVINCLKKLYSEETDDFISTIDFIVFDCYNLPILKIINISATINKIRSTNNLCPDKYLTKQYFFKYESQM